MKFRRFGKTDWECSVLGFGCMRLPTLDGKAMSSQVDHRTVVRMIHSGIDSGINLIDTAYPYHQGQSEIIVGQALDHKYRNKVKLSTKCPTWLIQKPSDFDRYLEEQLIRLGTDHIDFYPFHGINEYLWNNIIRFDLLSAMEHAIQSGKIGSTAFSFHGPRELFNRILDYYANWAFCMIQLNYIDVDTQAGIGGLSEASARGIPVIVMEPLRGGKLALPPKQITETIKQSGIDKSPAELALQWVWNQPGVTSVLSGMRMENHIELNVRYADVISDKKLNDEERDVISRVRDIFNEIIPIKCTECNYCMPCPADVNIPKNLRIYNEYAAATSMKKIDMFKFIKKDESAQQCISCGQCEKRCPQEVPIMEWMKKIADLT